MPHIDVRAEHRNATLPDSESAIAQVIVLKKWSKHWIWDGISFGRSIDDRRKIDNAIKAKDYHAFVALPRRGYWRVRLK